MFVEISEQQNPKKTVNFAVTCWVADTWKLQIMSEMIHCVILLEMVAWKTVGERRTREKIRDTTTLSRRETAEFQSEIAVEA